MEYLIRAYRGVSNLILEIATEEFLKVPTRSLLKIFNRFKEKVLFKAKEDINKFTDLQIDFIEKKLAKKVVLLSSLSLRKSFLQFNLKRLPFLK